VINTMRSPPFAGADRCGENIHRWCKGRWQEIGGSRVRPWVPERSYARAVQDFRFPGWRALSNTHAWSCFHCGCSRGDAARRRQREEDEYEASDGEFDFPDMSVLIDRKTVLFFDMLPLVGAYIRRQIDERLDDIRENVQTCVGLVGQSFPLWLPYLGLCAGRFKFPAVGEIRATPVYKTKMPLWSFGSNELVFPIDVTEKTLVKGVRHVFQTEHIVWQNFPDIPFPPVTLPSTEVVVEAVVSPITQKVVKKVVTRNKPIRRFYQQDGYCYLYLFPYRKRVLAKKLLGRNPSLDVVVANAESLGIDMSTRPQRLHFVARYHANVVKCDPGKLPKQLKQALLVSAAAVVGGDGEQEVAIDPYDGQYRCAPTDAELAIFLGGTTADDLSRAEMHELTLENTSCNSEGWRHFLPDPSVPGSFFSVEQVALRERWQHMTDTRNYALRYDNLERCFLFDFERCGRAGRDFYLRGLDCNYSPVYEGTPPVPWHLEDGTRVDEWSPVQQVTYSRFKMTMELFRRRQAYEDFDYICEFGPTHLSPIDWAQELFANEPLIFEDVGLLGYCWWSVFLAGPVRDWLTSTFGARIPFDIARTVACSEGASTLVRFWKLVRASSWCEDGYLHSAPCTSPLDDAINMLRSPENQNQAEGFSFEWLGNTARKVQDECPWYVKVKSRELANKLGLSWSSRASDPHTHPIHAALRRRSYREVANYWRGDVTVMFMKKSNYEYLANAYPDKNLTLANHFFEVKDIARYSDNPDSLGHNVFNFPKCDTPIAHWDEAGHYKKTSAVAHYFADNPKLRMLTVTHIFPMESLSSTRPSDPDNASWRKTKDLLVYLPENDEQNPYYQPCVPELLLARSIRCDDQDIMLFGAVVWKGFNTYLQVWVRYHLDVPKYLPVDHEKMMMMPKVLRAQPKSNPIPVRWWVEVYMYLKTIKNPVENDVWAKVRQINGKGPTVDIQTANLFCEVVLRAASKTGVHSEHYSKYYDSFTERIAYNTVGRWRKYMHKLFRTKYVDRWMDIVNDPNAIGLLPLYNAVLSADESKPDSGYLNHWTVDIAEQPVFLDFFKNIWNFLCGGDPAVVANISFDVCKNVLIEGQPFINMTPAHKRKYQLPDQAVMDIQSQDFRMNILRDFESERAAAEDVLVFKEEQRRMFTEVATDVPDAEESKKKSKGKGKETEIKEELEDASAHRSADTASLVSTLPEYVGVIATEEISAHAKVRLMLLQGNVTQNEFAPAEHGNKQADIILGIPQPFGVQMQNSRHSTNIVSLAECTTIDDVRRVTRKLSVEAVAKAEETPVIEIIARRDLVDPVVRVATPASSEGEVEPVQEKTMWENYKRSILRPARPQIKSDVRGTVLWDMLYPLTLGRRYIATPFRKITYCPDISYPDQDCLLTALNKIYGESKVKIFADMVRVFPSDTLGTYKDGLSLEHLQVACLANMWYVRVNRGIDTIHVGVRDALPFDMDLKDNHWSVTVPKRRPLVMVKDVLPSPASRVARKLVEELSALPIVKFKPWTPEFGRAQELIRAMYEGTTGLLGASSQGKAALKAQEAMMEHRSPIPRFLAVVNGDPGCRKSSAIQKILAKPHFHKENAFKVVLPTNTLRADWSMKLAARDKKGPLKRPTPKWYIDTFETALATPMPATVAILDEHKFSVGYLALLALRFPNMTHFIFLGDPHQSQKHEVNSDCHLNNPDFVKEGQYYEHYSSYFLIGTYRFDGALANILRMPAYATPGRRHNSKLWFADAWLTSHADLQELYPGRTEDELKEIWKETLTMVPGEADVMASQWLNMNDVVTNTGSQGLSAKLGQVILTPTAIKACDIRSLYTAFTRAEDVIVVLPMYNSELKRAATNNPLLDVLLNKYKPHFGTKKPVRHVEGWDLDVRSYLSCLSPKTEYLCAGPPENCVNLDVVMQHYPPGQFDRYVDPDRIDISGGHQQLSRDDPAYKEAYQFLTHVDLPPPSILREVEVRETPVRGAIMRTHLLKGEARALDELVEAKVNERFDRELSWKGLFSEQMPDGYLVRADGAEVMRKWLVKNRGVETRKSAVRRFLANHRHVSDPENDLKYNTRYVNWGQYQRSTDRASFMAGVEQRIRRVDYSGNLEELNTTTIYGAELFKQLKVYMQWGTPFAWDELLYEECQTIFSERRASRSQSLKKVSLNRSEPDYIDMLTAKNQLKMKEHDPPDAKPLQTILIKSDEYLHRLGGLGVYLLKMIQRHKPPSLYLHAQKTIEEMFAWFDLFDPRSGLYVGIDIKGYDGTQRGASLNLELLMLEFFNVPEDMINFYREDKLDAHTKNIMIGLMRLSGELFTWLFNTVFQIARTVTKYQIPPADPMAASGDDVELFRSLIIRQSWHQFEPMDVCEEKLEIGDRGSFCSWIIKDGAVFKDPMILFMRLQAALSRGKAEDVVDGYFLEFKTLWNQGDKNVANLCENEQEFVNHLSNFFHNMHRTHGIRRQLNFSDQYAEFNAETSEKVNMLWEAAENLPVKMEQEVDVRNPIRVIYDAFQ